MSGDVLLEGEAFRFAGVTELSHVGFGLGSKIHGVIRSKIVLKQGIVSSTSVLVPSKTFHERVGRCVAEDFSKDQPQLLVVLMVIWGWK
jgi:hypothetical protein